MLGDMHVGGHGGVGTAWLRCSMAATLAAATPVRATFSVPDHVIAGGGVHASSACFELAGTIAQPVAGVSGGGGFALASGFWAMQRGNGDALFRDGFEECGS
jgi:hypothetical protein